MSEIVFALTIATAFAAGLFMAWAIGAVAIGGGAFAPAVGAKALPVRRAALLLGVVGFFGALLQGASVTETVGQGLVRGGTLTPMAASVAILLSATLMAIGAFGRYPIPAAFTVTGAMVGAGIALGGEPAWATYSQFAALWIVAPVLVGILSYGIARHLSSGAVPSGYNVAVIVALVFGMIALLEFPILGDAEESVSLTGVIAAQPPVLEGAAWIAVPAAFTVGGALLGYWSVRRHGEKLTNQQLLIWLGIVVAFSGAGNQIGLAVGPMLPLLETVDISGLTVLIVASAGLVVGAWTGAPRLIEAVAEEYATLSPNRAIAALVPAFLVAQIGIQYGVPVSFNEVIISAIIGSGLATNEGIQAIGRRKIYYTVAIWIASLIAAFGVTYLLISLASDVGGL